MPRKPLGKTAMTDAEQGAGGSAERELGDGRGHALVADEYV